MMRVNRNIMESDKLFLSIRPAPKNSIPKLRIRTDKLAPILQGNPQLRYKNIRSHHDIKQRQNSLSSYKHQPNPSHQTSTKTSLKHISNTKNVLPQIINPSHASFKYYSSNKVQPKVRKTTADSMIESRKQHNQTSIKEHSKTEMIEKAKSFKLKKLQQPKQMNRQDKQAVFRVIRTEFNELINASNSMSVRNKTTHFRAYIQKGNNGILVKQILKKRWWWHLESDITKANLIWTQWFNKKITADLKNMTIDEAESVQHYQRKQYNSKNGKSVAVQRLVDQSTFRQLQNTISLLKNNYFKQHRTPSNRNSQFFKQHLVQNDQIIHNHVEGCLNLHSKKLLFLNFYRFMVNKQCDPFLFIPLTFFIDSPQSETVHKLYQKCQEIQKQSCQRNIWIVKPGQNSNRGNGIKVVGNIQQLKAQVERRFPKDGSASKRTVIVQKYLQKCFLIKNRKFDIRCYLLVTTVNGILKGYWYKDGYIRTSSSEFSLQNFDDQMIHLTNDAVQKKGSDYGKHQDNNKMSYQGFKQYLKKVGVNDSKFQEAYEEMKQIAYNLMASVSDRIKRKQFTFELFGLDYMVDSEMRPILIEANSNPCLENSGKILGKLIHQLVENVFMTAVDPIFPPPSDVLRRKGTDCVAKDYFESNKFELIFTGKTHGNDQ